MDDATRQVLWNIKHVWVMYVLLVPTAVVTGYGVYRHVRQWRRGQPSARFDRPIERLARVLKMAILQATIWRDPLAGALHAMMFWGFVTLLIATTVVMIDHDFNVPIMKGSFYLYFQSLFVDCLGALAMVGVALAAIRRWGLRPKKLVFSDEANGILVLIFVILASGFLLEGWRIAATNDEWSSWSPVGLMVARVSITVVSVDALRTAHLIVWWGHLLLVFGLIAWAPYTKLLHIVTAPLNIYTSNLDAPAGSLQPIDFESAEVFGVKNLEQFTWKDLLDLDSCTECGQCTSVCPANAVGKVLSPRDIILDLQRQLPAMGRPLSGHTDVANEPSSIIADGTPLSAEALWQCTTCGACVETCPVAIEQYPKIVDMRRFLVMEDAQFPRTLQGALTSMEQRGHPFRGTQASRTDWADGLDVPHIKEVDQPEVLLWVGCGGALVDRNQKSTRALAKLLQHAGVKFGILGRDESCTGDPARRIGNEFLFDTLARQTIETLNSHQVHTVVTACPHCFNTFRNEYPQFGGKFEVYHHTTYLAKLIGENRLTLDASQLGTITLHDPCYLGRHNGITDEPRQILAKVSEAPLIEMEQHGTQSFCCGGGGGMSFVDEPPDQRVNVERSKQALSSGADTIAVACPFCTTMLEDGVGALQSDRKVVVKDVAELLWDSVENSNSAKADVGDQDKS
ncbi:MAG: heterodisulfide reductase-related iron-sulfur binding cluster [Pirellulaceae bacterium]